MKASEFVTFLSKFALQLRELRAYEYANAISECSILFQGQASNATVAAALKPLSKIDPQTFHSGGLVGVATDALKLANITLKEFGKPALLKDIQATLIALEPFKHAHFADLLRSLEALQVSQKSKGKKQLIREELVASYNDRLFAALSDQTKFKSIFEELNNHNNITSKELIRLAKVFRGETVNSGPGALKSIWARHESLLDSDARIRASAGRSAA